MLEPGSGVTKPLAAYAECDMEKDSAMLKLIANAMMKLRQSSEEANRIADVCVCNAFIMQQNAIEKARAYIRELRKHATPKDTFDILALGELDVAYAKAMREIGEEP